MAKCKYYEDCPILDDDRRWVESLKEGSAPRYFFADRLEKLETETCSVEEVAKYCKMASILERERMIIGIKK